MEAKLYALKPFESISYNGITYTRVPGGWLAESISAAAGDVVAATFIPFNNEFQPEPEPKDHGFGWVE